MSAPYPAATLAQIDVSGEGALRRIALHVLPGVEGRDFPCLVWFGGYRSDMTGTKAVELESHAVAIGAGCVRFDYSGHGLSGGDFADGTISRWLEEALAVLDHVGSRRMLLVGSSMGAWIALRAIAELRKRGEGERVAGLVLIAPAPDFTIDLIEPSLSETERRSLSERGYFEEPSEYSAEPNIFTRALIEDGRQNKVMSGIIETGCPVHILQGMADPDVPYAHALKLMEHLPSDDVVMTLIRDGDHRLSRPQDIAKLKEAISAMLGLA